MFLVTTADQRFWKKTGPVLFLGEWCKLYLQKAAWENMPHEVMPYHWDDRKKLHSDYQYLQGLYERVLESLSASLNRIHGEDYAIRHWRIIIGAWLSYFIQIFFDRYSCIELAVRSGKAKSTLIGRYPRMAWRPKDYGEFVCWSTRDDYNQFLYSWLIEHIGGLKFDYVDLPEEQAHGRIKRKRRLGKKILKKIVALYEWHLPRRFNRIVPISSYFSRKDVFRLQLSLKQWPFFSPPRIDINGSFFDIDMREQLSFPHENNQFERLLGGVIKEQMPFIYLEGYRKMKEKVLYSYPKNPDVVLTANDLHSNDAFKLWTAYHVAQGKRLLGVQHGGVYGLAFYCAAEEHEIRCSDIFYSWGWESDDFTNVKPLSAVKLNSVQSIRPKPAGRILLALMTLPRYSYHLYSIPVSATGMLAYFRDQFSFVKNLIPQAQEKLLIRFHPEDYGWDQKDRWQDRFPGLEYDFGKVSMHKRLRESRLFVGTYNATGYIDTFTANFPTILYWDPGFWELRKSVKPYFDELKRVGILYDTPESAAKKVNEIFADPLSWWRRKEIQRVRDDFCRQFAYVSDTWLAQWKEELQQQARFRQQTERHGADVFS